MDIGCEVPGRSGVAAQDPDGKPHSRNVRPLDLDHIDARDQVDGLVRDEIALHVTAEVVGVAVIPVVVIVGDELAQGARIAGLGRSLRLVDQRADLVLRRARRLAGREQPGGGEDARGAQDKPPTAAACR